MKAVLSFVLAMVVLINSAGITVATHFCGGQVAEMGLRLGNEALSCGMEDSVLPADGVVIAPSPCCQDQHTVLATDDGYPTYDAVPIVFLPLVTLVRWVLPPRATASHPAFSFFPTPPPLTSDRFVWHHSFLI